MTQQMSAHIFQILTMIPHKGKSKETAQVCRTQKGKDQNNLETEG